MRELVADGVLFLSPVAEPRLHQPDMRQPPFGDLERALLADIVVEVVAQEREGRVLPDLPSECRCEECPFIGRAQPVGVVDGRIGIADETSESVKECALLVGRAADVEGGLHAPITACLDLQLPQLLGRGSFAYPIDEAARITLTVEG